MSHIPLGITSFFTLIYDDDDDDDDYVVDKTFYNNFVKITHIDLICRSGHQQSSEVDLIHFLQIFCNECNDFINQILYRERINFFSTSVQ